MTTALPNPQRHAATSGILRDLNRQRLETSIDELETSITFRRDRASDAAMLVLNAASTLVQKARNAAAEHDVNAGWMFVHSAEREIVEVLDDTELQDAARVLRAEAKDKLGGWRQTAVGRLLGGDEVVVTVASLRTAMWIRDDHAGNLYYKAALVTQQLKIIGALLAVGTLLLLALALGGVSTEHFATGMVWAANLGAVGGLLSAARGVTQGVKRKIPEHVMQWPVTLMRPCLGAAAGVVAFLFAKSNVVTIGSDTSGIAPLIAAVLAGFSERYFLSLMSSRDDHT